MPKVFPELHSSPVIHKLSKPILTKDDIPYDAALVFNAGVVKHEGKYLMVFRDDYGTDEQSFSPEHRFKGTMLGIAVSDNGIDGWKVW